MTRHRFWPRRGFSKRESRVFCTCELCRLRFGRLLYPRRGGEPLGMGQRRWLLRPGYPPNTVAGFGDDLDRRAEAAYVGCPHTG